MFEITNLDQEKLKQAVANAERHTPESTQNPWLLFKARQGQEGWILGQEALTVTGQDIIMLTSSIKTGYVAFEKGEGKSRKLGELLVPLFSNQSVDPSELERFPNANIRPQTTALIHMLESSIQAELRSSTTGMENAFWNAINQILGRIKAGKSPYINPRLNLAVDSYNHPTWGKTYTPVLAIVDWCDANGQTERKQIDDRV